MAENTKTPIILAETRLIQLVSEKMEYKFPKTDENRPKSKTKLTFSISTATRQQSPSHKPEIMLTVGTNVSITQQDDDVAVATYESEYRQILIVNEHLNVDDISDPPLDALRPYLRPLLFTCSRRAEQGLNAMGVRVAVKVPDDKETLPEDISDNQENSPKRLPRASKSPRSPSRKKAPTN
ncbi:hypothetical protein LGM58_08405 [Burkholderia contaminans]|uniref:hypothetical protein n=1 Tax=Burkholderia contaminans TaxID=488447 RepID=UPI001CF15459|nr:hypothetical protein [Burkholderia contaminans]MCA7883206.1 hypothetical protein [Burkholderia contaminans]